MKDSEWKIFLTTASQILGKGYNVSWASESWCAFTTFASLEHNLHYWTNGIPGEGELSDNCTKDGGLWRQSFYYQDIAHFIIPKKFYWEKRHKDKGFQSGYKEQNIALLSSELKNFSINHRLTDKILEIKLY